MLSLLCLFWLGSGFRFPTKPFYLFHLSSFYVVGIPISLCFARPPPLFPYLRLREHLLPRFRTCSPSSSRRPPGALRLPLNLYHDTFTFSRLDNRSQPSSNICRLSIAAPCTLICFCTRESFGSNRDRLRAQIWHDHKYMRAACVYM